MSIEQESGVSAQRPQGEGADVVVVVRNTLGESALGKFSLGGQAEWRMTPKKLIQFHPADESQVAAEIGRRVRALREGAGVSQEQLANMAGLHYSTVSHIERGNRSLRVISILRLAEGLQCDPGDLVGGILPPPRLRW